MKGKSIKIDKKMYVFDNPKILKGLKMTKNNYIKIGSLDFDGNYIDQYFITYHLGGDTFYIGKNKVHCELCECPIARFGPMDIVSQGSEEINATISFAFGYASKYIPTKTEIHKKFKKYFTKIFTFAISEEEFNETAPRKPFNYVIKTPYILNEKDIKIKTF